MRAVSESKSDEILRHVDHLISEGHSSVHFVRQMVRFLRNATVAKVAGKDSSLLQISSEERERVGRVAEQFSEEDLTRHLQIMLRTHSELAYKQEQRFHLELGLLKMSHAQKLLPLEQFLTDVAGQSPRLASSSAAARPAQARPPIIGSGETRRPEPGTSARPNFVSPFAADSARKGMPRTEDSAQPISTPVATPRPRVAATASQPEPVIMGSVARAEQPEATTSYAPRELADYVAAAAPAQNETQTQESPALLIEREKLQAAVLEALTDSEQNFLAALLSEGEWSIASNEVSIRIAEPQSVLDMAFTNQARSVAVAAASGALGRAIQLKVVAGAAIDPSQPKRTGSILPRSTLSARGRAEQDPVVRRMQERFGAEIRTVVDHTEKRS